MRGDTEKPAISKGDARAQPCLDLCHGAAEISTPPLGYAELNRIISRIADKEADRIERELAE